MLNYHDKHVQPMAQVPFTQTSSQAIAAAGRCSALDDLLTRSGHSEQFGDG